MADTASLPYWGIGGMGRLYQGVQLADNQPVIVKEYLLPKRYFNHQESFQFKQAFENLGGLSLADGRVQNSRLISPVEAIADRNDEESAATSLPKEL